MSLSCEHCSLNKFYSDAALFGHYRHCHKYLHRQLERKHMLLHSDEFNVTDCLHDEMTEAINCYLSHQEKSLTLEAVKVLQTGYVNLLNGTRGLPDLEVYLRLCHFIAECTKISNEEADAMIRLVKKITHLNGKEVPVAKSFKKLHASVMKEIGNRRGDRLLSLDYRLIEEYCFISS